MKIDVHGHYLPAADKPEFADLFELRPNDSGGSDMYVLGRSLASCEEGLIDLSAQIEDMDRTGIDLRLLCVPPFAFHYAEGRAAAWSAFCNDKMREDLRGVDGGRFMLLGTLPMGSAEEAVRELRRIMSFGEFAGVEIGSNIAGTELGDPSLLPFWKAAGELDAFVLIHPAYTPEIPFLKKYHLRNLIGNPLDTTMAAFSLIAGGVMERFPSLRICMSHGGGYTALAVSRFDHGYKVRRELKDFAEPPSRTAKKFYYDTVMHDPGTIRFMTERLGEGHVLMGTDYPFDMGDPDPLKTVNALRFSDAVKEMIAGGNAKSILRGHLR